MTSEKKDFYGKEVTDAIKKACEKYGVPQEELEIEIIETGSTGMFGLIRKTAHIRVQLKEITLEEQIEAEQLLEKQAKSAPVEASKPVAEEVKVDKEPKSSNRKSEENGAATEEELPQEALDLIGNELKTLLDYMGYSSPVEVEAKGISVLCKVGDQHEDVLTGHDGKTLDSIQYLLRKIVARKVPNRLRLTVNVGNYRERRLEDLKVRALELATKVKEDGKTQIIPALSPSERRVVHMSLQDDKEIRSRSVGDGLFKKILIYKPGKGKKGNHRRRGNSKGRRGSYSRKKDR